MWRIKRRRTKPIENKAKTGVIYPKFNATSKPNRYVNRNTYLDVKCNRDKGAGCTIVGCQCSTDPSGNCCKTTPYRNPILGYRKHLLDCSGLSGCGYTNDVSGNVYKDNYAKSCGDPANSLVCYNPVIKRTQNRNGCVNESYNYSTNQYLTRRCLTFPQQEFNFQSQVPVDASGCCTKFMSCANCQYTTTLNQTQIIVSAAKGVNTLLYTKDGINWVGLGASIFGEQANVVKYNGTIWVAGGLHSIGLGIPHTLAYSYDGLNWVGNSGIVLSQECYDIAYSSDYWLAIGKVLSSGNLYSLVGSTDGKTWSEIAIVSPTPFFDSTRFTPNGIAYGGGKWILFGTNAVTPAQNIYYSTDNGVNWTVASISAPGFTIRAIRGYYNGTIWVAVGQGTRRLAWSPNGVIWINATGDDFDGVGGTDVFYNGDLWVASGGGAGGPNKLLYSTDGKNWLAGTFSSSAPLIVNSVTYGKLGPWVAGSGDTTPGMPKYYYSSDGITWADSNAVDVTEAGYMDSAITSSSISPYKCTCSTTGFCTGINKLPCEVKNTKCFAIYKRSNSKFNKQGAVSGGSRINRLKYQTRIVAQGRKVNGRNNVINRRGPAANYMTSRPLTLRDTTCVNPPPGPVNLSHVELSPFTFTINWSIANINELCRIAPLTGFTLQRTGSPFGHTVTLGSGSRTYTYTGIVTGSYNVRIKSDSYYGSSDWTYLNNIIVNFDPPAKIISFSDVTNSLEYQSRANTINDISSAAFLCAPGATPCLGGVSWYSVVTPLAYEGVYSGPWNLRFSIYLPTEYNHISITYNNPHGGTVFIFIGGSGSGAPPDENPGGGQAVSLITATTPTTPSTTNYGQSYQAGDYLKIQEHNSVITTALVITLTLY